jgi:hypothetical protein
VKARFFITMKLLVCGDAVDLAEWRKLA